MPDVALRASAPSPLSQVLNAFPIPNGPDVSKWLCRIYWKLVQPGSLNSTSVRFDHAINDKLRLFFRFSDTAFHFQFSDDVFQFRDSITVTTTAYTMKTYTAGASSVLSNRLSNEFRLNYSSNEVKILRSLTPSREVPL